MTLDTSPSIESTDPKAVSSQIPVEREERNVFGNLRCSIMGDLNSEHSMNVAYEKTVIVVTCPYFVEEMC
ncbi:hypothetical protein CDAR_457501 [Caerostris darwini]|uniref:Uncharacterized protein n=1 Tax=Caerostris darwini TaxID=1538125 RepID=A0AAV4PUC7_9ARAC|nr:hypothetical protein CDAR_457501 [Caerostris darwini]